MFILEPHLLMAATLFFVLLAILLYAWERMAMEIISVGIIGLLLVFYTIFPYLDADGNNLLRPSKILAGFSNPALITVLSLLVIGQAIVNTRSLERATQFVVGLSPKNPFFSMVFVLIFVLIISAFLNNTPVVVIFIPIMQVLADRFSRSASAFMMPLSFVAILGGMTTLLGSSTNLLISNSLADLGLRQFSFFEFTVPGLVLAATGFLYIVFIAPKILPNRRTLANTLIDGDGKQFLAQVTVNEDSKLIGEEAVAGIFPSLKEMTVRMILRGEHAELTPFDGFKLRSGDVLVVAATKKALTNVLATGVGVLSTEYIEKSKNQVGDGKLSQILSEIMITPGSRLVGQNLEQIGFRYRFNSIVLGLQRRTRMIRTKMTEIALEAGDILLVQGSAENIESLRNHRDLIPMAWSYTDIPSPKLAMRANIIFFSVIALAATHLLPIVVAAVLGAAAVIFTGVINIRQAGRAIDRRLFLLIVSALALGTAMYETGAAAFLADIIIQLFGTSSPAVVLSAFFFLVAFLTNIISNNACAVLFTPIAVNLAETLGVDPMIFAIGLVFAANCSFVTPLGYQTNLLVIGPGHYKFNDFVKVGLPLSLLLWLVFSLFVPWYYGL
jgi:di/tricarboxylate transporter|tara:strand:+ start:1806 stop:3644 length:1839 start_codon:yes stop_codon:yes gene_type:complete